MTPNNPKCRLCQFQSKPDCSCNRCRAVRFNHYCNEIHQANFHEEMRFTIDQAQGVPLWIS